MIDGTPSLPQYEFYLLLTAYTLAFGAFVLCLVLYVFAPFGLSRYPDIDYVMRAMSALRLSASVSLILTLPLLLINAFVPCPVANPMTSFATYSLTGDDGFGTHHNTEGNGRMSWNFSVCRPLFGILGIITCYVADNHRFFRVVAGLFVLFQVCTESIAAFDVARALRTLHAKCLDSATGLQLSSDCLSPSPENYWSEFRLTHLLRRDALASFFLLLSFFFVIFLCVTLGFTVEKYSYSTIHPRYNQGKALWKELGKHGINPRNFKEHVRSGCRARGSLDSKANENQTNVEKEKTLLKKAR